LIYFVVVYFSWDAIFIILKSFSLTGLFSLILVLLISSLSRPTK
jgi:hypothetical protein